MISAASILSRGAPPSVKAGGLVVGVLAMLGLGWLLGVKTAGLALLAAGIGLVALLLVAYTRVLKWLRKRKSAPLESAVRGNSAAAPSALSEPARRARLDDLRKSFEGGLEKFRAAGKDLYALPWYLLVGEPGSGKTEAIRHCNIGFPPGLQDQLQGSGGTINMNWWFTNNAIILDTAGRLMFDEVEAGATSEWKELLRLLAQSRPNQPINGMLLVVPADSLVSDRADEIERKAGKIAQQLDVIQRTLSVRFPVFIFITKADLGLFGFREYFDRLDDPTLQHQILGWSNPDPLDSPFRPELVQKHLETVRQRLIRRRLGLLIDPIHTEDPDARRVDQVDALYAFPDSLLKIGPSLRRYLEMIFVSGEWSPKPLFLRGIYFTSSMQKGAALDKDLADALGVRVDSLPQGPVWKKDRAYFLRDLFNSKIFPEKGLVTRAGDTRRIQRNRRLIVHGASFAAVIILLGLTILGFRSLSANIGSQALYWDDVRQGYNDSGRWTSLILPAAGSRGPGPAYRFNGQASLPLSNGRTTVSGFNGDLRNQLKQPIWIPYIFRPLAMLQKDPNALRTQAARGVLMKTTLEPLIQAARDKMKLESAEAWTPASTAALVELLRLEGHGVGYPPPMDPDAPTPVPTLKPLFRYVLSDEDYASYQQSSPDQLQDSLAMAWSAGGQQGGWPDAQLATLPGSSEAILAGSRALIGAAVRQGGMNDPRLVLFARLGADLKSIRQGELNIAEGARAVPDTSLAYESMASAWRGGLSDLDKYSKDLDATLGQLDQGSALAAPAMPSAFDAEVDRVIRDAQKAYEQVLAAILPPAGDRTGPMPLMLVDVFNSLQKARNDAPALKVDVVARQVRADLDALSPLFLTQMAGQNGKLERYLDAQRANYRLVDDLVRATVPATITLDQAAALLQATPNQVNNIQKQLTTTPGIVPADAYFKEKAYTPALAMLDAASRHSQTVICLNALAAIPPNRESVANLVKTVAGAGLGVRAIPMTMIQPGDTFNAGYSPAAAVQVIMGWNALNEAITAKLLDHDDLKRAIGGVVSVNDYCGAYLDYWLNTTHDLAMPIVKDWHDVLLNDKNTPHRWTPFDVNGALEQLAQTRLNAIQAVALLMPLQKAALEKAQKQLSFDVQPLDNEFRVKCLAVLGNWRDLNLDPSKARMSLLLAKSGEIVNYLLPLVPVEGESPTLTRQYWFSLTLQYLKALAAEGQKNALAARNTLVQLHRFPLAPPDLRAPLTLADLQAARDAVSLVGAAVGIGTTPSGTLGDGADLPKGIDPEAARYVSQLRGLQIDQDPLLKDWLPGAIRLLDVLPTGKGQAAFTLSTLDPKVVDDYAKAQGLGPPTRLYTEVLVDQGGKPIGKQAMGVAARLGDGFITDAANSALIFHSPLTPGQPANLTDTVDAPWAILRLLYDPQAHGIGDGHEWHVPLKFPNNQKVLMTWIKVEFKLPVPLMK